MLSGVLIISRIYTISSLICRSPEDSEIYVISSGEDEVLLLEQATNAKQRDDFFHRVPYKRWDFGVSLLNLELFCYLF